jgi:hypothetical protein
MRTTRADAAHHGGPTLHHPRGPTRTAQAARRDGLPQSMRPRMGMVVMAVMVVPMMRRTRQ